jgi:hypothetical protein
MLMMLPPLGPKYLTASRIHQKGAEYVRIELSVEFFFGHFLKWL